MRHLLYTRHAGELEAQASVANRERWTALSLVVALKETAKLGVVG